MQTLPLYSKRAPIVAGAICLTLATLLAGCASKNPLMEEPAPMASSKPAAKKTPEKAPEPIATTAPAATPAVTPTPAPTPTPVVTEAKPAAPAEVAAAPEAPKAVAADTATITAAATDKPAPQALPATKPSPTGVQVKQEKRFLGFFRPYRPDIQQGNFITQEMVAQLKEGMSQDQVIFLLGTPLLNDVFHADRWDYPFRMQKGNGEITTSRVTVYFKDHRVSSFEGGDLPTEADYLERIANKAKEAKNK